MTKLNPFLNELQKLGTPERAIADQRYHKSSREHWGVPAPSSAALVWSLSKDLKDGELLEFAKDLWETNLFDPMVSAAKILCLPKLKPSPAVWKTLLHFLKKVDGWALEDGLAHAAWKCILADESLLDELEVWTSHPNFWMRRAALVYTLPFAKSGRNPERMLGWASRYSPESEWFIQKAIGWWLRVLGAHNPQRVSLFLQTHWGNLKGVAKKEGTRKLSAEWQKKISEAV
jgi:3-methyladenine DNA glycosylase AlkD